MKKTYTRRHVARSAGVLTAMGLISAQAATGIITPEQVEGPFYPVNEASDDDLDLTRIAGHTESALGEVILVRGRILGSDGHPVKEAVVDVWQANTNGRYPHAEDPNPAPLDPNFIGFGVMKTSKDGKYAFKTIKPGAYALKFIGEEGWRCRHIHFKVSGPGFKTLITQMYFEGDPLIETDEEVAKIPKEKRHLLIVKQQQDTGSGLPYFNFEITLAKA